MLFVANFCVFNVQNVLVDEGFWKRSCFSFKYLVGKCPNGLSTISGFVATNMAGNFPMLMKHLVLLAHISDNISSSVLA